MQIKHTQICTLTTGLHQPYMGNRCLSSAGVGKSCALPLRVPNPTSALDKNLASVGPGILSSIGVGVWRNRSGALPDSNTMLDKFQSANTGANAPNLYQLAGDDCPFVNKLLKPGCALWVVLELSEDR